MVARVGRAWLIKISDGAAGFTSFAGLTGKSLKIDSERIDVTTPDAVAPEGVLWRATVDGVKSISASGDGKLVKDASEARLVSMAMSPAAADTFQIVVPNVGTFEGVFSVAVELGDDGAVTFTMSLESSGAIAFTPEP